MRPQHHDVGDLEAAQQQRQQPQIRGQHVDLERGIDGAAALQPDVVEGDVAAGKYETSIAPVMTRSSPVTARICAPRPGGARPVEEPGRADQPIKARPRNAAIGIPRRFIPWAIVKDISSRVEIAVFGRTGQAVQW